MDVIQGFYGKLRSLAITLDSETARLYRALEGEDSDFEDYPMKILCDLHSEVRTLKDDVDRLLHKASLESQENTHFIKATKVLMEKNSTDIMKIREFFQKYGYTPRAQEYSEHESITSKSELAKCENLQDPNMKDDVSVLSGSVSEMPPRSPQLSDFGLERYMIPHVLPNRLQEVNDHKDEPAILTPSTRQSATKALKTPKCALKMDDFECMTPKLEHCAISEYTYLNEDYTMGLKIVTNNKKRYHCCLPDAAHTDSPLAPTFCTPGLKVPSTKNGANLVPTDNPLSKTMNCSTTGLEEEDYPSLVLNSKECFENLADPSSPKISSYENLLSTPTPPEVTAIPEDILQILSRYNPNLATPVAVKGVAARKVFLTKHERKNIQDDSNKEN
ncbi:spindle and kinetochore-associated protein 3 [Rhynchocyon petersi]